MRLVNVATVTLTLVFAGFGCGDDTGADGAGGAGNSTNNGGQGGAGNSGNAANGGAGNAGNSGGMPTGGEGGAGNDGGTGGGGAGVGDVVVNEILSGSSGDEPDWFELYNAGDAAMDLSDWTMTDDEGGMPHSEHLYTFPAGTTLAPGAYLVVERTDDLLTGFDFGLGDADAVYIFDDMGGPVDTLAWDDGQAPDDSSFGHFPDASGNLVTMPTPSKGASNTDQ